MEASQIKDFRASLLHWFRCNRRDLPWRRTHDPYAIWISEIMLQQTRVAAVIGHYERFMQRFPTVVTLALAREEDVIALWSGLGYYRRARLLHRAAQFVMSEHDGYIPRQIDLLRRMPGVGVYTSAAIASIAHGEPVACVDGNVERVLARMEGLEEQRGAVKWQNLAQSYLDPARPGDFNQAMMELGATVCTPHSPACSACPVHQWCRTRGEHAVRPRKQMRSVEQAYGLVVRKVKAEERVLMLQRPAEAAIMPAMWELPLLAAPPARQEPQIIVRHAITNTNYYVRVFRVAASRVPKPAEARKRQWATRKQLQELPLTGLARKILRRLGHIPPEPDRRPRLRYPEQLLEF